MITVRLKTRKMRFNYSITALCLCLALGCSKEDPDTKGEPLPLLEVTLQSPELGAVAPGSTVSFQWSTTGIVENNVVQYTLHLGLAEIGKAEIDPETYKQALWSMIKLGTCAMIGGNCSDDLDVGLGPEDYKRLYTQYKELQGTEWVKFMTKLTYGAIITYSTRVVIIQGKKWVRIGRWMRQSEYDKIVASNRLQASEGDMTHILLDGPEGFRKQAPRGSLYVEFDISADTFIGQGGNRGWGIIFGEKSTYGKYYLQKNYKIGMPETKNIKIIEMKN